MRLIHKVIPFLLIPLLLSGCRKKNGSDEAQESLVKLSHTSITLSEDKTFQLEAIVDDSLKNTMLFWTMRDEDIASVDDGFVTALKEGSTICTVQCGKYSAKCAVNVTSFEPEDALQIHLTKTSFNLNVNDTFELPLTVTLGSEVITNYTLTGEADNQSVAKIENSAVVALATGSTDIVLKVTYGEYISQDIISVNVF